MKPTDFHYNIADGYAMITGCYGDGGDVTIPATFGGLPVKAIGERAFSYCTRLKSVVLPASVTEIGGWSFAYCTGLTSVTIPASVTKIGAGAFKGCTGLKSVMIENSVTEIGDRAFEGCPALTLIRKGGEE